MALHAFLNTRGIVQLILTYRRPMLHTRCNVDLAEARIPTVLEVAAAVSHACERPHAP